jgi:Asp-tRNA(Asn)/Glu-tRNA(Gln) amidotransferase A subunit family amidase
MQDLWRKTANELAALVRKREISPVEILDAHLAVIDRLNPTLNAIVTLAADSARTDARAAEQAVARGVKLGPLHGLPIGIKDIVATANIRTTYGCPLYADNVPNEDAEVVRRLKAAGESCSPRQIRLNSPPAPTLSIRCSEQREIRGTRP